VKEQQELRQKLRKEGVCVVYGHGGVGKSTLVAGYGHNQKGRQAVWWMPAETIEKLMVSYEKLATELGINYQPLAQELKKDNTKYLAELTRKIYNTLEDSGQSTLLILDNTTNPEVLRACLLHRPKFVQMIITTRDNIDFKDYGQIKLDSFTREEGIAYIKKKLQDIRSSEKDIDDLINMVGLIPQKLALATGYISEIKFVNIERYLSKRKALEKRGKRREGKLILPEADLGLNTLDISCQLVMRYGAYLDPDFIPLSLLSALLRIKDEEKLTTLLTRLEKLSLITIVNNDSSKQGIRIHREVQAACREYQGWKGRAKQSKQVLVLMLLKLLNELMPNVTEVPDGTWDRAKLYATNAAYVLVSATEEEVMQILLADMMSRMGKYSEEVSRNYKEALAYHRQALNLSTKLYSRNHPNLANALNNMGSVYKKLGQYQKALKYYQQVLKMRRALYTSDHHSDLAHSLSSLGSIHQDLGHYQEALNYFEQAIVISKTLYTGNHLDLVRCLNNLGVVCGRLGRNKEALEYHQQAREMLKALYVGNHTYEAHTFYKAHTFNNIGNVYYNLSQHQEVLKYHQKALKMRQTLYTGNDPYIALALCNLGIDYQALGKYQEALKYLQGALEMWQALYTDNHHYIALALCNLGIAYQALGKYEESLKYHQQALEMRRALYTGDNSYIADSLNALGKLHQELKKYEEAFKYHQQAFKIYQALYTGTHPDLATSLNELGMVYKDLGNLQKALECYTNALKMFEALYLDRPEHLDIQKVKGNIEKLEEELRKMK